MSGVVVGLDLSTTRTGICVVPVDFAGDIRKARFASVKRLDFASHVKADDPIRWGIRTRDSMAQRVVIAADDLRCGQPVVAWAYESLPTRAFSLIPLAMLRAVVLTYLRNERVMEAPQSSARKLFIGPMKNSEAKRVIHATVRAAIEQHGNPSVIGDVNNDESDALVVANWAVSELGHPCISAG